MFKRFVGYRSVRLAWSMASMALPLLWANLVLTQASIESIPLWMGLMIVCWMTGGAAMIFLEIMLFWEKNPRKQAIRHDIGSVLFLAFSICQITSILIYHLFFDASTTMLISSASAMIVVMMLTVSGVCSSMLITICDCEEEELDYA